ncbi:hypothetical protein QQ045_031974 [Rhodiola kirilowii]
MNLSCTPGPDDFMGYFYRQCWDIIKPDLHKAVQAFFNGMQLPNSVTTTHLVLLPKKVNASKIDHLRPISLCNFLHKIISGILNSRLAKVLPSIISPEQSGFMPGRNIMESITLAHDLTFHINNGRAGGNVIMKVDMAKAYDRVSWLFLLRMMRALGFNAAWCDLVYWTISNCFYSVLWDGPSFRHFKSNRGVQQGDPLSPSITLLVARSYLIL